MKKLFISCPMKGRTEENIKNSMERMHKVAEIIFNQELEVIPTYIEDTPPENKNQSIWYLGKSIELLAQADFFIGVDYSECFKGCNAERNIARDYGIRSIYVGMNEFMSDAEEVERRYWDEQKETPCRPVYY